MQSAFFLSLPSVVFPELHRGLPGCLLENTAEIGIIHVSEIKRYLNHVQVRVDEHPFGLQYDPVCNDD
jgi:hypothetical protein